MSLLPGRSSLCATQVLSTRHDLVVAYGSRNTRALTWPCSFFNPRAVSQHGLS